MAGEIVLAGTGHRPDKLGGYGNDVLTALYRLALGELRTLQPDRVISGMAQGWDTALALAAITMNIHLTAAIPFKGQELRWPTASQERYRTILSKGKVVVRYVSTGGYSAAKMQIRNRWMVDRCNVLLALWNQTPGGTGNCVEYAKGAAGVTIVNCWERWKS